MELNLCFTFAFLLAFRTLDFSVEDLAVCLYRGMEDPSLVTCHLFLPWNMNTFILLKAVSKFHSHTSDKMDAVSIITVVTIRLSDTKSLTHVVMWSNARANSSLLLHKKEFLILWFMTKLCRPRWSRGLRCRSAAVWLLGSLVRIPLRAWMFVSCVSMLCCPLQVEASATGWSLVQRSTTVCVNCIWSRNLNGWGKTSVVRKSPKKEGS
jgi:hypothetical protein